MTNSPFVRRSDPTLRARDRDHEPDEIERLACAVGGSLMLLHGLRRSSLVGLVSTFLGLCLARRAIRGETCTDGTRASSEPRRDPVEAASEESFPASDPPSWTASHAR
jgi:uncharacterized membrane protein